MVRLPLLRCQRPSIEARFANRTSTVLEWAPYSQSMELSAALITPPRGSPAKSRSCASSTVGGAVILAIRQAAENDAQESSSNPMLSNPANVQVRIMLGHKRVELPLGFVVLELL